MRRAYTGFVSVICFFLCFVICTETHSQSSIGKGDFVALSKVVRTVWDESQKPRTDMYVFEYADHEFRTTVSVHSNNKIERVADAFFNTDRTLSFVRKGEEGNPTETIHFVYDANGNLLEKRVSHDDTPFEKFEYEYDESNLSKRDIKRSEWSDGKWKPTVGSAMSLFVNESGLPTAFENIESAGQRIVVFEYGLNGAVLDSYTDSFKGQDGNKSDTFAYISYGEQKPNQFTIKSSDSPDEEVRITGQWQKVKFASSDKLMSEVVEICSDDGCRKVEERTFEYMLVAKKPLMPPPSMMLPFLELGSSLCYIENPEVLIGKEGIGLPTWLIESSH